ncbi:MAG TPA: galactose-1-phosphate uridylyltransferase [Candidatus Dormibacteraeota bacterium]
MPRPARTDLFQPDGRHVYLYGEFAPPPSDYRAPVMPEGLHQRRWNPLRREWVLVAASRQGRTFLPERNACPLCPSRPGHSSEIPASRFEAAVFDNRFPAMVPPAGQCEVVVYTDQHEGSFGTLRNTQLARLGAVWTDRVRDLSTRPGIRYIFIFENRGEQVGVTLHHPHGQIYAYPFVPPVAATELRRQTRGCLQCRLIKDEIEGKRRMLIDRGGIVAYVPGYARWPYEIHVAVRTHRPSLLELTSPQRMSLLDAMQRITRAYDQLFGVPMPYMMSMHQAPVGRAAAQAHLHVEFYPILRDQGKLKYLAGTESGAGVFVNDAVAEASAERLRTLIQ